MGKKNERMNQLVDLLILKNGATVKELASHLQVSEMTIRRDLSVLHEKGIVNNVYGAAILNPDNNITESGKYHINAAVDSHHDEKERIGKFASTLINANDMLIIDTGSTTGAVAKYINPEQPLKVLCYNHNTLNFLVGKPKIKLIFSGGFYHANTQMFEGPQGIALIESVRASKVFISAAGIHETMGITCVNGYEVATKRAIMKSSYERILVADSSKFSVIQTAFFAELEEIHTIITDTGISQQWISLIEEKGIKLHIV